MPPGLRASRPERLSTPTPDLRPWGHSARARQSPFGLRVPGKGGWETFSLDPLISPAKHTGSSYLHSAGLLPPPRSRPILLTAARVTILKPSATPVTLEFPLGQSPSPSVWPEKGRCS